MNKFNVGCMLPRQLQALLLPNSGHDAIRHLGKQFVTNLQDLLKFIIVMQHSICDEVIIMIRKAVLFKVVQP